MSGTKPRNPSDPRSGEEFLDSEAPPDLPSTTLGQRAALASSAPADVIPSGHDSTAEILRLSWPVMLGLAAVTAAGIIDRAMVGRLGEGPGGAATPLAAVGLASQLFFLIQSSLIAVGLACVALMARSIGANEPRRAQLAFGASIQVAVVVGLLLSVLLGVFGRTALAFLGANDDVLDTATPYLYYVLASSVPLGVSLVIESALRADRDMRTPMLIAGVTMTCKLGLNWLLIFGNAGFPRLELVGAGLATAISQALALVLLVAAILRAHSGGALALQWHDVLRANARWSEVVRLSLPGVAERMVMNTAMLSYIWVLGHYYGTLSVAAYTVGIPLLAFSWIPGQAYAQSAATLVGQSLGAREPERATHMGMLACRLAIATAIVLGTAVGFGRYELAGMLTNDADVIRELGPFMLVLAVAQPLLQLQFTLGGIHRGAGDTVNPLVAAMFGNWIFRVPLAFGFAIWLETDVVWIWYTLIFDHLARCIYLTHTFRRGRWKRLEPLGADEDVSDP